MLDNLVEAINRRLPEAPYQYRAGFVQTAPWLALLSAALGLILGGRLTIVLSAISFLLEGFVPPILYLVYGLSPILALISIPGLRNQRKWGWALFALSVLIDLVVSLVFLLSGRLDQALGLLFGALFLYYLLQCYSEYGGRRRYW